MKINIRRNALLSGRCQSALLIVLWGLFAFTLSFLTPWLDDEISYRYNLSYTDELRAPVELHTLWDVFDSQYTHYFTTNGRVVAHVLVQVFDGLLGQTIFAVCNSLVWILFIVMMMRVCGIRMSNRGGVLTLICLIATGLAMRWTPAFQMYLWMYTLVLVFLELFQRYSRGRWYATFLLCLFSMIAGNGHESLSPGIVAGLTVWLIANRQRASMRQWLMGICFGLGLLADCISPATNARGATHLSGMSSAYYLFSALLTLQTATGSWILVAIALYKSLREKGWLRAFIRKNFFWITVWAVCLLIQLFFGFGGGRSVLGAEMAAIVLIIRMLRRRRFTVWWLGALIIATAVFTGIEVSMTMRTRAYLAELRRQAIASEDGNVYVDFDYPPVPLAKQSYSPRLYLGNQLGEPSDRVYFHKMYYTLANEWNINKTIRNYPTALRPYVECKADTSDGNLLKEISPGIWLMVRNKRHPARFYALHVSTIPFYRKTYEPTEVPVYAGIFENEHWQACIYHRYYYHRLFPATFVMRREGE